MGCWNETCMISNLHIKGDQEVVVFVLTRNEKEYSPNFCYNNALYSVFPIPFYAKYNEYGGADECHGVGLDFVMDTIKDQLVEKEVGDNEYHDIEVKRDGFDTEKFFDACHENRLFIKEHVKEHLVDRVMIHKGIFDHILETQQYEQYMGYEEPYLYYKFADVVADLPEYIRRAKIKYKDQQLAFDDPLLAKYFMNPFNGLFEKNEIGQPEFNLAAEWLRYLDNYSYKSPLFIPKEDLIELLEVKSEEELVAFFTEYLKGRAIDEFISNTRKLWVPQSGKGSQGDDHAPYRLLIEAMTKVLDEEETEWEE